MTLQDTDTIATAPAPVAQLDRASVFGTEGRGFESLLAHHCDCFALTFIYGPVAQLVRAAAS